MALTATQLQRLRHLTGGIVAEAERDYLTDTELQAEYTEAGGDFQLTIVYVLRLRIGMTAPFIDKSFGIEAGSEQLSQRHTHMKGLLAYWEGVLGLSGTPLTVGTLDLGLDTDSTDVQN